MEERRLRDKGKTRAEILAAAEALFSDSGFAGTSLDSIASASGISKALILHHFGTKEELYRSVLEKLNGDYASELFAPVTAAGHRVPPDGSLVESMLRAAFAHTRWNDAFRRLGLWSYLEGFDEVGESERRITDMLIEGVKAGQEAGAIRGDIDPVVLPFIVKGAIDFWIRKRKLLRATGGTEEDDSLVRALASLISAPSRDGE